MVPRFSMMASRVMPMPLSVTVRVPAARSATSRIFQSRSPSIRCSFWSELKRTLSMASLALLISSRRKISL